MERRSITCATELCLLATGRCCCVADLLQVGIAIGVLFVSNKSIRLIFACTAKLCTLAPGRLCILLLILYLQKEKKNYVGSELLPTLGKQMRLGPKHRVSSPV